MPTEQRTLVEVNKLVLGRTQYGKSTLCKIFCESFTAAKARTLVLDTTGDPWKAEAQTDDPQVFIDTFWEVPGLACFVEIGDMSPDQRRRYNEELILVAKRGRHNFSHSYYMAHRLKDLDPSLRTQCPELFLFASGFDDARELVNDYGARQLAEAPALSVGEFYHVAPGVKCTRHHIDFKKRTFVLDETYE